MHIVRRIIGPWSVGLALALVICAGVSSNPAFAADAGSRYIKMSAARAQDAGPQVIRLGLNKSLVVDLPRAAKDVLVSNPKKADAVMRTPRRAYVIGMEIGQTNIFFFDDAGKQILSMELQVEPDVLALKAMFHQLIPGSSIKVDAINENIVLSGSVASPSDAGRAADIAGRFAGDPTKVLNMISVEGNDQVFLKVTVAEMQRTAAKQLGVNFDALFDTGNTTFRIVTDNSFGVAGTALNATRATGNITPGNFDLFGSVRFLEENGLLRTLAEPTLAAVSGESASFLAGGEFPIPVASDNGDITIEFKPFGVALAFTPVVMSEGRISLKVKTEVSETTTDGGFTLGVGVGGSGTGSAAALTIPALKVRRADTTIELPSGGSLVIAGLIQQSTKQALNGVPGAKDMPVLGALFRSRDFQNDETELVVIVTPYTVDPVNRKDLALPTDGFAPAADYTANLMGRLHELYGVADAKPTGSYKGRYGFIID